MNKGRDIAIVMGRVAKYEEKRLIKWLLLMTTLVSLGLAVLWFYGTKVWYGLDNLGIFDLISLTTDDFESTRTTVLENMGLIWEFLPKRSLIISLFTLVVVLAIIFVNRKWLRSLPQRVALIIKFLKKKGGDD